MYIICVALTWFLIILIIRYWIQFIIMKIVMKILIICPKSPRFTVHTFWKVVLCCNVNLYPHWKWMFLILVHSSTLPHPYIHTGLLYCKALGYLQYYEYWLYNVIVCTCLIILFGPAWTLFRTTHWCVDITCIYSHCHNIIHSWTYDSICLCTPTHV